LPAATPRRARQVKRRWELYGRMFRRDHPEKRVLVVRFRVKRN
jgi:hypothetical protein